MSANQEQEMWTWKFEPVSPSGTPPLEIEDDDWVTIEGNSVETANNAAEPVMYDDQPTRAQVATKLLEELDEWIKEEPFSDWLEEKIELPIFEDLATPECIRNKPVVYPNLVKPQQQLESTQTLLQEFESVLGDVGACHQVVQQPMVLGNTLTPPQSPPPNKGINIDTQLLVTLQPVQPLIIPQQVTYGTAINNQKPPQIFVGQLPSEKQLVNTEKPIYVEQVPSSIPPTPWSVPDGLENLDVSNELDVVEEFVRSYARDIAPPSPCVSTGGSCASSEDSTDDPDWIHENNNVKRSSGLARNRHKPYSRPNVEDKKVRKKEQNKNAATRYRQKKKQEIKEILGEENELTEHNKKLQNQLKDLQREIGYLKGLMRDLFKAKGLMK